MVVCFTTNMVATLVQPEHIDYSEYIEKMMQYHVTVFEDKSSFDRSVLNTWLHDLTDEDIVIIVENNYLICKIYDSEVYGKSGWIHYQGLTNPDAFMSAYGLLGQELLDRDVLTHVVITQPGSSLEQTLFTQSFGLEQVHAVRRLQTTVEPTTSITLRQASEADQQIVREIATNNVSYQQQSPMFAAISSEQIVKTQDSYVEAITDPASFFYLAEVDGTVIGYAVYYPSSSIISFNHAIELPAAGILPEFRFKGYGHDLIASSLWDLQIKGYCHCVTDWRSTNPLASIFWPRQDFNPYLHRLVRRLDPLNLKYR